MDSNNNKITHLSQQLLQKAIAAGIYNVIADQDYLNKINVFPVPDGDTGTNLTLTLSSIISNTETKSYHNLTCYLDDIADNAINGARGNSGTIFAEFFVGFSEGAKSLDKAMSITDFIKAVNTASQHAHQALSEPTEGTILTVMGDFCAELNDQLIKSQNGNLITLLELGLKRSKASLHNTTNQLTVLQDAGVVDAGAKGFVDFIEGFYLFLLDGSITQLNQPLPDIESDNIELYETSSNNQYRYCTECILSGEEINLPELRKLLNTQGDCVVIAGSVRKAKIHLHTNDPQQAFDICQRFGNISREKADDMRQQQSAIKHNQKVAILTDSCADFDDKAIADLNINIVPINLILNNQTYLDKVTITPDEFYQLIANGEYYPKTSQPSIGSFIAKYQYLTSHYHSAIAIHIPKFGSGTFNNSVTAANQISENITVIDSGTITAALGMIVKIAAEAAAANWEHKAIITLIEKAKRLTQSYMIPDTLEYLVKGGRLPKHIKTIFNIIKLKPIMTMSNTGKPKLAGVTRVRGNLAEKFFCFLRKKMLQEKHYRINIAHANNPEAAKKLKSLLKSLSYVGDIHIISCSPAVGCHLGPGALGAAVQENIDIENFA